ncbi:MAG: TetR/AcrR family transcriptional regulator [Phycisphaerales bacterium]
MGRPKSFDPDEVLCRAVDVFWEKGYEGASVDDLTRAMGINRFSMYSTFGDKHQLFLKALEKHERQWEREALPRLEAVRTFADLQGFLYGNIDAVLEESESRCGCVMVLTAVSRAANDPQSRRMVEAHVERFVDALKGALERIDASEGLAPGVSAIDGARYLVVVSQGIVVSGSGGQTRAMLRKTVRHALEGLGMAP